MSISGMRDFPTMLVLDCIDVIMKIPPQQTSQLRSDVGGNMNPLFAFVLGLLIGWLIEWLIDYFYWRRRYPQVEAPSGQPAAMRVKEELPATPVVADDLKVIKGIGKVIERKLNDAGVYTFAQLGSLSAADLRRILGATIERLSDEESLLQQARDLARRK